jgi:hypothetical protein
MSIVAAPATTHSAIAPPTPGPSRMPCEFMPAAMKRPCRSGSWPTIGRLPSVKDSGALSSRAAVSYAPVNHVAAVMIDGTLVASVPYTASAIKFVGVERNWDPQRQQLHHAQGTVADPPPAAVAPPATPAP